MKKNKKTFRSLAKEKGVVISGKLCRCPLPHGFSCMPGFSNFHAYKDDADSLFVFDLDAGVIYRLFPASDPIWGEFYRVIEY